MKKEDFERAKLPKVAEKPYYMRAKEDKDVGYEEDKDHDWFENAWKQRLNELIGVRDEL